MAMEFELEAKLVVSVSEWRGEDVCYVFLCCCRRNWPCVFSSNGCVSEK